MILLAAHKYNFEIASWPGSKYQLTSRFDCNIISSVMYCTYEMLDRVAFILRAEVEQEIALQAVLFGTFFIETIIEMQCSNVKRAV
jgi:hypothetical protein